MAEPSDNPCSSSSEDDEYSDPLEVAASAGARLSTPENASISRKRKVQTNPAGTLNIFNKHICKVCFVRIQSHGYRNTESQYRESDFYDLG